QTNSAGEATITLTSSTTAVADITVSARVGSTDPVDADKTVSFIADSASAKVVSVVLAGGDVSKVADGVNTFTYTVTVKDSGNNPVPGVTVVPASDKTGPTVSVRGQTNGDGEATITLTSSTTAVADITVSARVGSTDPVDADKTVSFIADSASAKVVSVVLAGGDISKVANGVNTFTYTVTVKDSGNNPVPGVTVEPASDKGHVAVGVSGQTNSAGEATITLTSTTTAVADITVSARVGSTDPVDADKTVSFIADSASAKVVSVVLAGGDVSKVADGVNTFTYTVTVKDSGNNPVPGVTVEPASDKGHVAVGVSGQTNSAGEATITLTSSTTAVADITVSARVGSTDPVDADKTVSFIADSASAKVVSVVLAGGDVSKVADGVNTFTYTVTVKDSGNNPVPGVTVEPASDKGHVAVGVSGQTNSAGEATITLTSSTTAVADITVSARVGSTDPVDADKTVSFIADSASAKVVSVVLAGGDVSKVADGVNTFTYTVTVKDSGNNPVPGVTVEPASDKTGPTVSVRGQTNGDGEATITLTSSTTAVADITVSARVGSTDPVDADKTVSFIADSASAKVVSVVLAGGDVSKVADGVNTFTYTVTVKDSGNNPVPGMTVVPASDKTGPTVLVSGTTNADGEATITLTSTTMMVTDITVSAQVGSTPSVDADKTVSFVIYTFTISPLNKSIVTEGTTQYTVIATPADGSGDIILSSGINWTSSKPAVASINAAGLATGLTAGESEITAIGTYRGAPYDISTSIFVLAPNRSPVFGESQPGDSTNNYIVQPPSYSIAMRCGWIVDAMGTTESLTGGPGGALLSINNVQDVVRIDVTTAIFSGVNGQEKTIAKLVYTFKDNSTQFCGTNQGTTSASTSTYTVPTGYVLQGYEVSGGRYIHAVRFISMPVL
ncbi:hypothetical protein C9426_32090, partial [Serratia sp. S1B]